MKSNDGKRKKVRKSDQSANEMSFDLPELPSLLTKPLGIEGWGSYEPVLLAALASGDPLLLIGSHGSAKSFLLEQLAQTLGLDFRFCNASLINYDDLVGIPIPSADRKSLEYITTPSAIWNAEVVFFDEINRTRPELQNKLFPIIHERRVQGIRLEKLKYRWSAMNPPPSVDNEDDVDVYLGAEPLDPALADRFAFIIEVPGWQKLTDDEKRSIFRDQFTGTHDFPVPLADLVSMARAHLDAFRKSPPCSLEDYLLAVLSQLESNGINSSTRRATMLQQNILAVHSARMALYQVKYPEFPPQVLDWNTSALLALQNSIPQAAQGKKLDASLLLGAHRQAWEISMLDSDNPWRVLLSIQDPLDRCVSAVQMKDRVDDSYLSQLVLDAVSSQPDEALRMSSALALYLSLHRTRDLRATVYETLARELRRVLRPGDYKHVPDDCPRERYRGVKALCEKLEKIPPEGSPYPVQYSINLLQGLLPDGYGHLTPRQVLAHFTELTGRLSLSATQEHREDQS